MGATQLRSRPQVRKAILIGASGSTPAPASYIVKPPERLARRLQGGYEVTRLKRVGQARCAPVSRRVTGIAAPRLPARVVTEPATVAPFDGPNRRPPAERPRPESVLFSGEYNMSRRLYDPEAHLRASHGRHLVRPLLRPGTVATRPHSLRGLAATAAPPPVGELNNGSPTDVLLQGFHYTSFKSNPTSWYAILAANAAVIRSAPFDAVWLPRPAKPPTAKGTCRRAGTCSTRRTGRPPS